jgi:hypothetical protein
MPKWESVNGNRLYSVTGFSKNPSDPFASGGTREGPFFEFKNDRFTDLPGSAIGFPEYKDPFPGQTNPYRYFSSYDGNGYKDAASGSTIVEYAGSLVAPDFPPVLAYRQGSTLGATPFKSKSYQIISPGQDHKYGPGGPYIAGSTNPLPEITSLSISSSARDVERDNITNFSNGLLVP